MLPEEEVRVALQARGHILAHGADYTLEIVRKHEPPIPPGQPKYQAIGGITRNQMDIYLRNCATVSDAAVRIERHILHGEDGTQDPKVAALLDRIQQMEQRMQEISGQKEQEKTAERVEELVSATAEIEEVEKLVERADSKKKEAPKKPAKKPEPKPGSRVFIQVLEPAKPKDGDRWRHPRAKKFKVYYSGSWVTAPEAEVSTKVNVGESVNA